MTLHPCPLHGCRLLTYLEEAGQKQLALRAFQFMLTQPLCFETRDAFIYAQLMKTFSGSRKDSSIALQLFQDMKARGLQLDLVAYNTAITAAGKTMLVNGCAWQCAAATFGACAAVR